MRLHLAVLATVSLLTLPAVAGEQTDDESVRRGAYLALIMDCGGCHTPRGSDGAPIHEAGLSGGTIGFEIPGLGTFWPPNLTPDATGLGGWSAAEISTVLRTGVRPDGRIVAPAMPWPNYAALTEEDMAALVAFLMDLEPVEHGLPGPLGEGEVAALPFYRVILPQ